MDLIAQRLSKVEVHHEQTTVIAALLDDVTPLGTLRFCLCRQVHAAGMVV